VLRREKRVRLKEMYLHKVYSFHQIKEEGEKMRERSLVKQMGA